MWCHNNWCLKILINFHQVLAGHEGPVSTLSFSPKQSLLASGSWDKTVKLWDVFENKGAKENIIMNSDGKFSRQ